MPKKYWSQELVVTPKGNRIVPSLDSFLEEKASEARNKAASHILTQTEPNVPILPSRAPWSIVAAILGMSDEDRIKYFGTTDPQTCIYTATSQYEDAGAKVSGNKTFRQNPAAYGFEEVPMDSVAEGDLVQFTDLVGPHHSTLMTGRTNDGEPTLSYSNGNSIPYDIVEDGDTIFTMVRDNKLSTLKDALGTPAAFRYKGSPQKQAEWRREYFSRYNLNPIDFMPAMEASQPAHIEQPDALRVVKPQIATAINKKAEGGSLKPETAWDALSMREKAEMMRVAVKNGITNLQEIRQKYNEFAEGGDKKPVTTGGAGYIPDNYGQGGIDYIRRKLYDNVQPWGYNDIPQRVWNAVVLDKTEPYDDDNESRQRAIRDDLWATYLQIPHKDRHNIKGKVTLEQSPFKPKGAVEGKDTYRFKQLSDAARQGILAYTGQTSGGLTIDGLPYLPLNTNRVVYPEDINAYTELEGLGQFTVGRGRDNKGEYVSYYDSWDLGDTKEPYKDKTLGIGKPFNMYDRIYLDDYYGVPEPTHATYLPEVTVYGNKKHSLGGPLVEWALNEYAKGGGIHIKPENRGKFTALKERTGHSATWFKEHGTPAQKKMATFALNSRHWNKHALGGYLKGEIYDLPEEEIMRLINAGYEIEYL